MIDFIEICRRAFSGPLMHEKQFDMKFVHLKIAEIIKKYGFKYDSENPVNTDDSLADAVFDAAITLLEKCGVYCTNMERVIQFTRKEIEDAIRQAPGEHRFGEGIDSRVFKPRKPDDITPSWCHIGSGVATSSEEIAFKVIEGYARIPEADSIAAPSLSHLRSIPITGGSPIEVLGAIRANQIARGALQQAGRPGLPILNLNSTSSSAIGTIASSRPLFGTRISDGWIVGFLPELKLDFGALDKVAYLKSWGASIGPESSPILGGYSGGPVGVAIINVAYIIAGILVMRGSYQLTFPIDIKLSCSTTRPVLWAVGISSQAISRNISYPFLSLGYVASGPMTENYFYEATAFILTAVSSGSSSQTPIPSKAIKVDYQTPLEMQFSAEVIKNASQIPRADANRIVKRLLEIYEKDLDNPLVGKSYTECFDVSTGYPTPEYLELYTKMEKKISKMGVLVI